MRISDFQGRGPAPRWIRREAARRDYREWAAPGWRERRAATGREAKDAARALRAAERLARLRAARAAGVPAPKGGVTALLNRPIRKPGPAARRKTLGHFDRRILRVEVREDGREWSYHATKGWRSRRLPVGG